MALPKHDETDLSIETDNDVKQRRLSLHMHSYHNDITAHRKSYFALNREHKDDHKKIGR
jgi:hypothetical protein